MADEPKNETRSAWVRSTEDGDELWVVAENNPRWAFCPVVCAPGGYAESLAELYRTTLPPIIVPVEIEEQVPPDKVKEIQERSITGPKKWTDEEKAKAEPYINSTGWPGDQLLRLFPDRTKASIENYLSREKERRAAKPTKRSHKAAVKPAETAPSGFSAGPPPGDPSINTRSMERAADPAPAAPTLPPSFPAPTQTHLIGRSSSPASQPAQPLRGDGEGPIEVDPKRLQGSR